MAMHVIRHSINATSYLPHSHWRDGLDAGFTLVSSAVVCYRAVGQAFLFMVGWDLKFG